MVVETALAITQQDNPPVSRFKRCPRSAWDLALEASLPSRMSLSESLNERASRMFL